MQSKVLRIPWTSLSTSCQMSINFGLGNCGIAVAAVGNAALLGAATFSIAAAQAGSPLSPWQLTIGTLVATIVCLLGPPTNSIRLRDPREARCGMYGYCRSTVTRS
jgi:hypothetical protein